MVIDGQWKGRALAQLMLQAWRHERWPSPPNPHPRQPHGGIVERPEGGEHLAEFQVAGGHLKKQKDTCNVSRQHVG